jgi:two-component system phosphate regulon sensor histidine kinase PhoR
MEKSGATRIRRLQRNLKLTGAIVVLSVGVLLPVLLSTSVGIIALVVGEGSWNLIFGILIVSFTSAAIGGAVIVTVLLGRRARTARLQADLLANVTHELRTPLTAIRMYAQTLEMGLIEQDVITTKKCVDTIIRETEWLETMIERVLTWRSLAKDRDELELVVEPVGNIVEETALRFAKMILPEQMDFSMKIDTKAPVLHDKRGLSSIVINLLTNASKYTGEEKKISISVQDEESHVVIGVQDNGIGIPEKELKRIFDPFYRVDSHLKSKASGAGLGLAIVNHLVVAHFGTISVDTTEGEGSLFLISLPKHESTAPSNLSPGEVHE